MTGNKLCCGCFVAKSSHGWIKLLWPQGAQVKTQHNSILSVIQMRDNGCLVKDVAKAHGGTQMMLTPNGVRLPFIIINGLPYLEHYYPTERQLNEITREESMTTRNTMDPTKLDDVDEASDLMISQFPPIPLDAIDSFYNDQGDICASKNDLTVDSKVDPAVVDLEVGPAVGDSKVDSKVNPAVVDWKVGPAGVEKNERYHPKPTGEYRSKPKKKKRNQR